MSPTILEKIFEAKRGRVQTSKRAVNSDELKAIAANTRAGRRANNFRDSITQDSKWSIIAEIKRASPSKGNINEFVDVAGVAAAYESGGAAAISVLTEEDFFKGAIADLEQVRSATGLPILRKDFIFEEYQVWESAAAGADAILLIASMLDDASIAQLSCSAAEFGMDALVEVHTARELDRVANLGVTLIGVNNRDLRSFEVSLDVSRELIKGAPNNAVMVSESGLVALEDLEELHRLGYKGFLIGETLMRSGKPDQTLRQLTGERK